MTRRLVRQMLLAQALSALTVSLCLLIDNIMINRFLGEVAIAAYELASPVLLIIGAGGSLMAAGIQVACSRSLGSGSREETNKGFSSAAVAALAFSTLSMLVVILLRGPIARIMGAGASGELHDQTRDYLAGFFIGAPGSMGALVLVPFLQMAGQSNLLVAAVLGMTVSDVAFDLLNVLVLHGGMFGMGLASALSYYVAVAVGLFYFASPRCVFRFSFRRVSRAKILEILRGGVPTMVNMASFIVLVFVLNRVLMHTGGAAAVAAYAVGSAIGNAGNCISTGMNGVSLTLSGIFYNEEDRTGLKKLLGLLVRYSVILGLIAAALLVILAPACVSLFLPGPGETREMAILAIRLFAVGLTPCCLNNAFRGFYQGTERVLLTEAISVFEGAVFPSAAALILGLAMGTGGAWLYFIAGEGLALAGLGLYVYRAARRKGTGKDAFLMLKEDFGVGQDDLMEVGIHTIGEAVAAAKAAGEFCVSRGMDRRFANRIALCVEEMAGNIVEHGFAGDRKNHLLVRIQHKDRKWVLRFRDDCRAFDPVSYVPSEERESTSGIRLVMAMADEVRYTYSLSLNNLTAVFHEKQNGRKTGRPAADRG